MQISTGRAAAEAVRALCQAVLQEEKGRKQSFSLRAFLFGFLHFEVMMLVGLTEDRVRAGASGHRMVVDAWQQVWTWRPWFTMP